MSVGDWEVRLELHISQHGAVVEHGVECFLLVWTSFNCRMLVS